MDKYIMIVSKKELYFKKVVSGNQDENSFCIASASIYQ